MEYNEETIRELIELLALNIIDEIHWQDSKKVYLGEYTLGINGRHHYDGTYKKWYPEVKEFYYFVQNKDMLEDDEEPIIDGFANVGELADLLIDNYLIHQEIIDAVHGAARKRNEKMIYRMRGYEKTLGKVGALDEYYNYYTSDDHEIAIDQLQRITDTKIIERQDLLTRYFMNYSKIIMGSVFNNKYTMTVDIDYDTPDNTIIFTINDAKTKKPILNGKIEKDQFVSIRYAHNNSRGLYLNLSYLEHQDVIDSRIDESDIIVSTRRVRDYYVLAFQLKEEKNE
ncbi:MAG TPA: hypothetical protein PKZ69_00505 [Candidatus Cloacimonadota bacterium]|nr:hypothetical protein [Candidatus Cloacimonadota bacterium]